MSQCLKITEKVSFDIASEASYFNIFSTRQKLIKNAKNDQFGRVFESMNHAVKQCYQTQTGQFNSTKIGKKKLPKLKHSNATF